MHTYNLPTHRITYVDYWMQLLVHEDRYILYGKDIIAEN